jgi:hypothetical protein
MLELLIKQASRAEVEGDHFCRHIERQAENFCHRELDEFHKAREYYERKRNYYSFKFDEWACTLDRDEPTMRAYGERLEAYCASADGYTIQEESLEFTALSKAHDEITSLRYEHDAVMADLAADARRFIRIADQLIHWQIEPHHFYYSDYGNVYQRTVPSLQFYHYR